MHTCKLLSQSSSTYDSYKSLNAVFLPLLIVCQQQESLDWDMLHETWLKSLRNWRHFYNYFLRKDIEFLMCSMTGVKWNLLLVLTSSLHSLRSLQLVTESWSLPSGVNSNMLTHHSSLSANFSDLSIGLQLLPRYWVSHRWWCWSLKIGSSVPGWVELTLGSLTDIIISASLTGYNRSPRLANN